MVGVALDETVGETRAVAQQDLFHQHDRVLAADVAEGRAGGQLLERLADKFVAQVLGEAARVQGLRRLEERGAE